MTIQTDHKSFESIALKNQAQSPRRLARMLFKVQGYDFYSEVQFWKAVLIVDWTNRLKALVSIFKR